MELSQITVASVKVMRSFDYCHFEICMSSSDANTPEKVDELRKTAARLADKAVKQYQIRKASIEQGTEELRSYEYRKQEAERIRKTVEGDRTVREQATLKAFDDAVWQARQDYDYEDDYQDD